MHHSVEAASATPDAGLGGRLTECRIEAWNGSRPKAAYTAGTFARLTIETAEEDVGSQYAAQWVKQGALQTRTEREERFKEVELGAQGYVKERAVGDELWDRAYADAPGFDLSGYGEVDGHGRRDILVTWRASQPIGRSVSVNLVLDERARAFGALNAIAMLLIPAFALSPGEFGSPGPPSPEPAWHPAQRYKYCPSARVKGLGSTVYHHFEVHGTSCTEAVSVMRRYSHGETTPRGSQRVDGWIVEEPGTFAYYGRRGRASFVCYSNPDE
ncbi:MAG TPA: hypothetical protein VKG38_00330 [Solirubrobacteraceae bacterium]|nr:hypothetical protein [Solirubrobacteraceae bacterium]